MKNVKTHIFNRIRYSIDVDNETDGRCDPPTEKLRAGMMPEIYVAGGLPCGKSRKAKRALELLLHECLHAEDYDMPENKVERIAKEISKLLWRLGYRKIKNGK